MKNGATSRLGVNITRVKRAPTGEYKNHFRDWGTYPFGCRRKWCLHLHCSACTYRRLLRNLDWGTLWPWSSWNRRRAGRTTWPEKIKVIYCLLQSGIVWSLLSPVYYPNKILHYTDGGFIKSTYGFKFTWLAFDFVEQWTRVSSLPFLTIFVVGWRNHWDAAERDRLPRRISSMAAFYSSLKGVIRAGLKKNSLVRWQERKVRHAFDELTPYPSCVFYDCLRAKRQYHQ